MIKNTYKVHIFSKTRAVFAVIIVIALMIGVFISLQLRAMENCNLIPKNLIAHSDSFTQMGLLCFWDILCIWLLAIPTTRAVCFVCSFCVFIIRGAVIGNSIKIFFMNSVPSEAVMLLLGYCAVTLLLMGFTLFLHASDRIQRPVIRVILSLIITGAASAIRILPYLAY